ncbi:MAG: PP2C family protein-serine/threonine phosphatase [Angustibacter sp.]
MPLALRFAARSDIGLGRYTNNQDSGYAGPHLLAVCDGMGGHVGGDIASSLVLGRLVSLDGESHGSDALSRLEQALLEANTDVRGRLEAEPELRGMGTTTTAVMLHGDRVALAHIGDSRGYLMREGTLQQITHDHSFVQSLVDEGRITEEEAVRHPNRGVITRVLSGDPLDEPDLSVREASVGDRYLLCSDGLTDVVRDPTIAETLTSHDDPAAAAQALVDLALRGGGADNVTVVVADVVDPADGLAGTVPEVVGSAAVHGTVTTSAAADSPAAKAAALERPEPPAPGPGEHADADGEVPAVGPPASRLRRALRGGVALVLVGLLVAGGLLAWQWSQRQYYVGVDGQNVAIYRGLPQDLGPLRMSRVVERLEVPVSSLPPYSAEQVRASITVDGLGGARNKVVELREQACSVAAPATATPSSKPTSTTARSSPSAGATPRPTKKPRSTTTPRRTSGSSARTSTAKTTTATTPRPTTSRTTSSAATPSPTVTSPGPSAGDSAPAFCSTGRQ